MFRIFLAMALLVLVPCQSRAACQTPKKKDVDERVVKLVEANDATMAMIRTAEVKATIALTNVDQESFQYRSNYQELHWTKKDGVERLRINRFIALLLFSAENPDEPNTAKAIFYYQMDHANEIYREYERRVLPAAYSTVVNEAFEDSAYEASLSRWHPGFSIHYLLGLEFYLNVRDETRTLKEMAAEWPAEYCGTGQVDGVTCDIIRVLHSGAQQARETPIEFYLDREAGTMIRRVVVHHRTGQLIRTVKRFYRGWNGVVFPLDCVAGFRPNDPKLADKALVSRTTVTSYTLNKHVADDDVRIPFPKGLEVRIYDGPMKPQAMPEQTHWGIVGENGQITKRLKINSEEWKQHQANRRDEQVFEDD